MADYGVNLPYHHNLAFDITCIDTGYYRRALAASYLMTAGGQAAFVDTGTYYTIPGLLALLEAKGIAREQVAYVMPTHAHLDHAGGAGRLMAALPNARLVAHPRAAPHLIDPAKLAAGASAVYGEAAFAKHFGELLPIPEERVIIAADGYELDFNGRRLRFLDTPGHARHHYSLYDETSNGFFTGDTFGLSYREFDCSGQAYIMPTTTPVHFDPDAWHTSLGRLLDHRPERMFLTHYGMVTDITRLAARLAQTIDHYATIARQAAQASEAGEADDRYHRIHQALAALANDELDAIGCRLSVDERMELLALDLDLNTQGLEVWLDRKKRTDSSHDKH